jgi:hypothetical protein
VSVLFFFHRISNVDFTPLIDAFHCSIADSTSGS